MYMIRSLSVSFFVSAMVFFAAGNAKASDTCSLSDVIQPAIDAAAEAAACNLDGTYVSPQLLAERVRDQCNVYTDQKRCRTCVIEGALRSAVTARTLVREGFFNPGAVIITLQAIYKLKDELCN